MELGRLPQLAHRGGVVALPARAVVRASRSPNVHAVHCSAARHVTVIFCDLVNSTGIAAKLDAEHWRDPVGAYLDAGTRESRKELQAKRNIRFGPLASAPAFERDGHAPRQLSRHDHAKGAAKNGKGKER